MSLRTTDISSDCRGLSQSGCGAISFLYTFEWTRIPLAHANQIGSYKVQVFAMDDEIQIVRVLECKDLKTWDVSRRFQR